MATRVHAACTLAYHDTCSLYTGLPGYIVYAACTLAYQGTCSLYTGLPVGHYCTTGQFIKSTHMSRSSIVRSYECPLSPLYPGCPVVPWQSLGLSQSWEGLHQHGAQVKSCTALAVSGPTIVTGGEDGRLHVLRVEEPRPLRTYGEGRDCFSVNPLVGGMLTLITGW